MRRAVLTLATLASIAASALVAGAQEQDAYLDDRSSPQELVRSLYNAVNRKEYARAWGYFGTKPAADLDAFTKGYETTEAVDIVVGAPASEGAAGSTFYTLPVAISAVDTNGNETIFAGCYVTRLSNPDIQGDPFQPMHIEKTHLAPASGPLTQALPQSCPDTPELPRQNALVERARAMFMATQIANCQPEEGGEPESWDIRFRPSYDRAEDPERVATLIQFFCARGAYNETSVYYFADDTGDLRQLAFAHPELDIRYEGDGDEKLESMRVIGFTTTVGLVNAEYDPNTFTLKSFSRWRGIGDASAIGTWMFRNGDFTLVKYEVDPTYDGESQHETVIDYDMAP